MLKYICNNGVDITMCTIRFEQDDVTHYKQLNENWEGRWIVWGMWIESKWWKCTKWKRVLICKIDNCICINQSFNVSYYILLFLYLSYYFALEKMLCKIIFCDHILHYEYRVNFAYNAEIYMDINRYKFHPWCIWWSLWCSELFIWHIERLVHRDGDANLNRQRVM